jgi:hypothetical protein
VAPLVLMLGALTFRRVIMMASLNLLVVCLPFRQSIRLGTGIA